MTLSFLILLSLFNIIVVVALFIIFINKGYPSVDAHIPQQILICIQLPMPSQTTINNEDESD